MIAILSRFAAPYTGWIILAVLLILAGTALELYRPYLLKLAIDSQITSLNLAGLQETALLYGLTIVGSVILSYGENYILQYIGQLIIYQIRQKVFCHLIYEKFSELERQKVGQLVTRVTNDTDAIRDLYTDVIVAFISDILILVGILIAMFWMNWQLASVAVIALPIMAVLALTYQKYARAAYRQVRAKTGALNGFLQEYSANIMIVKAFARFRRTKQEFESVSEEYVQAGLQEVRTFALFRPLVDLIYTAVVLCVLAYGGFLHKQGPLEVGVLVAFLRYVEMFFWPIKDIAEKYNLLQSALAAAERVAALLEGDKTAENHEDESPDCYFQGRIRFENVWFAYEGEEWVLKDVSFSLEAGEFVGIAGFSGSGKSTLVNLLARFYEPQRGAIYLDDVDIRHIPLAVLRRTIGIVFQEVRLFKGTVYENLALYDNAISREAAVEAAKQANAHAFIARLPDSYETLIGYQGALLSAGQRQLISLARVLLRPIQILALDEATSSIDSETEKLVQEAFARLSKERTMLVVAHRLSTIEQADKILVMDQGEIVESGSHQELLQLEGFYARLHQSQLHALKEAL